MAEPRPYLVQFISRYGGMSAPRRPVITRHEFYLQARGEVLPSDVVTGIENHDDHSGYNWLVATVFQYNEAEGRYHYLGNVWRDPEDIEGAAVGFWGMALGAGA